MIARGSSDEDIEPMMAPTHRGITPSDLHDTLLQHDERDESDAGSQHSDHDYEADNINETHSEPLPDSSSGRTITHARPDERGRSSSVQRPLKSAVAHSPSPVTTPESANSNKKRAHFDEEAGATIGPPRRSMLDLARAWSSSPSPGTEFVPTIASYDSLFTDWSNRRHSSEKEAKDAQEIAEAIGVFEVVVEQLMQAAEEHSDAHNKLVVVAKEVAGAILYSREEDRELNDQDDEGATESGGGERDEEGDRMEWDGRRERSRSMNRSSADDDVDESCITAYDPESEYADDDDLDQLSKSEHEEAHSKPRVMFATPDGELKGLDLPSFAEEPDSKAVISKLPPNAYNRRVSDSHTHFLDAAKPQLVPRRASMTDFTKLKSKLSHLPLASSKASPARCAVTACSVRASESPQLNTVYEHPGERHETLSVD